MDTQISATRRKSRIEQAANGWVVILLQGNNQQGEKLVYSQWGEVINAVSVWCNPHGRP